MNTMKHISGKHLVGAVLAVFIVLFLGFSGCDKETVLPREFPKLRTAPVTDINTEGAHFEGIIEKEGSEPIIDWGFVWSVNQNPKLVTADYYMAKYQSGSKTLNHDVFSTLVAGENYFIKFYARTASYIVYGDEVTFESLGSRGPEIHDFDPKTGLINAEVNIHGAYFSIRGEANIVKFDTVTAFILATTDSLLKVMVPAGLGARSSKISVKVADKTTVSTADFELIGPEITSFYPETGTIGDTVIIEGTNLAAYGVETVVKFNDISANSFVISNEKIRAVVPAVTGMDKCQIRVETGNVYTITPRVFTLTKPQIISTSPAIAKYWSKVLVNGSNFSVIPSANKVLLDQVECQVLSASKTQLEIIVPSPGPGWVPIPSAPQTASELKVLVAEISSDVNKSFTFLAPSISNLTPATGTFGDTLTFTGTNFSYFADEFKIYADNTMLELVSLSNEKITFKQPEGNESASIQITAYTDKFEGNYTFKLAPPKFISFSNTTPTFLEEVELTCQNLHPEAARNTIWINNRIEPFTYISNEKIRVTIPVDLFGPKISIQIRAGGDNELITVSNLLTLKKPVVSSISPLLLNESDELITISGNGFNPEVQYNFASFGDNWSMEILHASPTQIIGRIMDDSIDPEESLDYTGPINYGSGGHGIKSSQLLTIKREKPWKRLNSVYDPYIPEFGLNNNDVGFVYGNTYTYEQANKLYGYNPATSSFSSKKDMPGNPLQYTVHFELGGDIYVGMGWEIYTHRELKEFWRYDSEANKWSQIADFPGEFRFDGFAFTNGNRAYFGGGQYFSQQTNTAYNYSDLWMYDPDHNTWSRLNDMAFLAEYQFNRSIACVLDDGPYLLNVASDDIVYRRIFKYNITMDSWAKVNDEVKQTAPGYKSYFSFGNDWFVFSTWATPTSSETLLKRFNPSNIGNEQNIPIPAMFSWNGVAFRLGNKGIVAVMDSNPYNRQIVIWEFDPSKLP